MQSSVVKQVLKILFDNCNKYIHLLAASLDQSSSFFRHNYHRLNQWFYLVYISFVSMLESVHVQEKEFSGKYVILSSKTSRIKSDLKVFSQCRLVRSKANSILEYWKYFNSCARGYFKDKSSLRDTCLILIGKLIIAISNKTFHRESWKNIGIYPDRSTFGNHYLSSILGNISLTENKIREMICDGTPTKEIAIKLYISDPTKISHRKKLISMYHAL